MVNPVLQQVTGQLSGVVKQATGNIINNLTGGIGKGTDSSNFGPLQNKSSFYTKNLTYPLNVEGDPMQGHYILFHINKIVYPDIVESGMSSNKNMKKIVDGIDAELKGRVGSKQDDVENLEGPEALGAGVGVTLGRMKKTGSTDSPLFNAPVDSIYKSSGASSKRVTTSIALYMPPNVSVTYTPNYSDVDIGGFAGAIVGTVDLIEKALSGQLKSGEGGTIGMKAMKDLTKMAQKAAYKSMDAVAPGIRALMQIKSGRIISNKMELSFEGVGRREFSYTFIFIPKSEREAQVVEQIIYMFKYHALPAWAKGYRADPPKDEATGITPQTKPKMVSSGRSMTIPDTFDIEYMYQAKNNNFLNKISTCFCSNVSVQYGGDRYVAYNETEGIFGKGNPPQRTTLTLTFKEMEIITRDRVGQGF